MTAAIPLFMKYAMPKSVPEGAAVPVLVSHTALQAGAAAMLVAGFIQLLRKAK